MTVWFIALWACGAPPVAVTPAPPQPIVEELLPPAPPLPPSAPETTPAAPAPEPQSPEPAPPNPLTTSPGPDGASCLLPTDCASGSCEGEGCAADQPGVCVGSMRACTRDLRRYCGCDGQVFQGSGSCPNRRFSKRGPC